ncbi:MAG: T9SS type A sorting domain-containing protein, partial [Bacteroidota bacterium]
GRVLIATLEGLYFSTSSTLNSVTKASGTPHFESHPITDVEFASGGVILAATDDSLFRSIDNGVTFGPGINDSLVGGFAPPNNRVGGERIEVAVAPSNRNIVYVSGASDANGSCTGVWRSNDAGLTYSLIAPAETANFRPLQSEGRYALVLEVSPSNPDFILVGGEILYKYNPDDGWEEAATHVYIPGIVTDYVPSPVLSIAFDPNNDSTYFVGSDAEIVRTTDLGETFTFKTSGFNNAHLFSVSASATWDIIAGDRYQGVLYKDGGNTGNPPTGNGQQFYNMYASSSGKARFSMLQPNYFVAQNNVTGDHGGLVRQLGQTAPTETFYGPPTIPYHPSFGVSPEDQYVDREDSSDAGIGVWDNRGNPVTPWAFDEYLDLDNLTSTEAIGLDSTIRAQPSYIYMASRHYVWVVVNPWGDFQDPPRWNRLTDELVVDDFGLGKIEYITALGTSSDLDHIVYVGTSRGRIFRILDAHDPVNMDIATKVAEVNIGAGMPERMVTSIEFDPGNRDNLVVTYGAFAAGDDRVWMCNNAKAATPTFRSVQGNLPANLPVHAAAFHPYEDNSVLLLGTERGLYSSTSDYENTGTTMNWSFESGVIGMVPVRDIFFRPFYANFPDPNDTENYTYGRDHTLFIATHGRGIFKSSSLTYDIVSREPATILESGITMQLQPNPASDAAAVQFVFPVPTKAQVDIFGMTGEKVGTIAERIYPSGTHTADYDTSDLPAGIYFVKAQFSNRNGSYQAVRKQVVVK